MLRRFGSLCSPFLNISKRFLTVLGIETSCDDTAAAIVTNEKRILSDVRKSQLVKGNQLYGGVAPFASRFWHLESIEPVVESCVAEAGLTFHDIDAIAVTTRPGIVSSLLVGAEYAVKLCQKYQKPLIKVHHMRAHALTIRLTQEVGFPFLCFLISGGHCLLTLVRSSSDFKILGTAQNKCSPGEVLDKTAKRLKVKNISADFEKMSGGQAIETLASQSTDLINDTVAFEFCSDSNWGSSCDFDFSGLKPAIFNEIKLEEERQEIKASQVLQNLPTFCASVQHLLLRRLARNAQRAIEICDSRNWMPSEESELDKNLVLSGGVACNQYFRKGLSYIAAQYGYKLVCPEPKLCSDNGVMIAWNGLEILQNEEESEDILSPEDLIGLESIWCDGKMPIGEDWRDDITKLRWKTDKEINGKFNDLNLWVNNDI